MGLSPQRKGDRLKVNKKLIFYSFWPTKVGSRGNASLQSLLFSLDPWAIIDQTIKTNCPIQSRDEALACIHQSRDFYQGAVDIQRVAARPLSLYYCFMNLVKSLCLTRGTRSTFNKAQHGLSEQLRMPGNRELSDAYLTGFPSPSPGPKGELQNFSEFMLVLSGAGLGAKQDFDVPILLPQVLPGHRLWSSAANKKERFVAVHDIRTLLDKASRGLWMNLYFVSDDLSRISVTVKDFLTQSRLAPLFSQVGCSDTDDSGRPLVCFQQTVPLVCSGTKYANSLQTLFGSLRPFLWATVTTIPPYRKHYVYLCPPNEATQVLPQALSIYALAYYFGSITRYRPHHLPKITDGPFGPRVQDFITGQPQQFLYLLASEFAKREIARPSIL